MTNFIVLHVRNRSKFSIPTRWLRRSALYKLEMATAPRTRPCAVVGAPRRAAWQLKSVLRHSFSAAPRTVIFYILFTIIADKLFLNVQQWLVVNYDATII